MSPRGCRVLGIDLGTTNTKVALVDLSDAVTVASVAGAPTPAPSQLATVLAALIDRVLGDGPAPAAVGIASMAETGVPLSADGWPLGDWLRWDGARAGREAEELAGRLGWSDLVAATGTRPSGKVPLATWAWLRAHEPDRFAAMARWAGAADLVAYLLTGRLVTDHTLAGRTMAYRLPEAGTETEAGTGAGSGAAPPESFDADLLAEVGLTPAMLPDVVCAGIAGTATSVLPAGTAVVVAGHDHAVGAYAAGVRRAGQVADSVGTAEAVLSVVTEPPDAVEVARAGMSSVVTVDGRARAILAGSPSAGAAVSWWLAHETPGTDPDRLFAAARALADGPVGPVVLPYLAGRQAPAPDPSARMRVIGRRAEHTSAELARALLDGLSLQARWLVAEQHRLAGGRPESIVVLGGPLAANPAWLEIKARAMPVPMRVVTEAEAVAVGAGVVAAERAGLLTEAPVIPTDPAPAGPDPAYDQAFAAFVAAATEVRGDAA